MRFKLKQIFKMGMQHIVLPFAYMVNRPRRIRQGRICFADSNNEKCPVYMAWLKDELKKQGYETVEYCFNQNSLGAASGVIKMIRFMRLYATCEFVFICNYFLPVSSCKKKKKTKVIQLWHGAGAFKRFGYDSADDIPEYYKGNVHRNYNLVTVSGDVCVDAFASAMKLDKSIVKPMGTVLTDRYYDEQYLASVRERFKELFPDAVGKKVVVWAPTFRDNAAVANISGMDIIDKLEHKCTGGDIYIIKSLHPHLLKGQDIKMSTPELVCCADLLITDYSSVFFDYLIFDKPVIFYAPDFNTYYSKRGFYLEYGDLPGCKLCGECDEEKLYKIIENEIENDQYHKQRKLFAKQYMNGCDGKVTKRLIDYVKGKQNL